MARSGLEPGTPRFSVVYRLRSPTQRGHARPRHTCKERRSGWHAISPCRARGRSGGREVDVDISWTWAIWPTRPSTLAAARRWVPISRAKGISALPVARSFRSVWAPNWAPENGGLPRRSQTARRPKGEAVDRSQSPTRPDRRRARASSPSVRVVGGPGGRGFDSPSLTPGKRWKRGQFRLAANGLKRLTGSTRGPISSESGSESVRSSSGGWRDHAPLQASDPGRRPADQACRTATSGSVSAAGRQTLNSDPSELECLGAQLPQWLTERGRLPLGANARLR
jgi:hypothetical protein